MTSPRALPAPVGAVCWISQESLRSAVEVSRTSTRKRVIQPFHRNNSAPLQRMLNAVQPESYIPPHRHLDPPKSEAWVVLQGAVAFFTFSDRGAIEHCTEVRAGGDVFGVDLEPGVYHTFFALEPDTVVFEVKSGVYSASTDKSFAPWAPEEGSPDAPAYLALLRAEFTQRSSTKSA